MKKVTAVALAVLSLALYALPQFNRPTLPAFGVHQPHAVANEQPFFAEDYLSSEAPNQRSHVASICELSDGRLAAVWYSGTHEVAPDVVINLTTRPPGENAAWSAPRAIVSRDSASKELYRYIKTVGNPVIFADATDRLWLVYVTITLGGWSGSSLNVKTSDDGGTTWSDSRRLTLSPFLNVSELVRNNPLPLEGGGVVVPIYHEFMGKFPELLWLSAADSPGDLSWHKTRIAGGRSYIQPTVVPFDNQTAVAFLRDCSKNRMVTSVNTLDAGQHWSAPTATDLPNPNAAVDALQLSDGRLLIVFNDTRRGRDNLKLAVSSDKGATWKRIATLEDTPKELFAYPYMIRTRDGNIHLVYSWCMKRIKHVVFNEAWLKSKEAAQ
ncbi:MAG: hypothetical protein EHM48_06095 [Planctomycetaceae bacterium]|nr:MAG: hypothetical protein EHM48_06095 [Planctomycetaceae bacterium]